MLMLQFVLRVARRTVPCNVICDVFIWTERCLKARGGRQKSRYSRLYRFDYVLDEEPLIVMNVCLRIAVYRIEPLSQ